MKDPTDDRPPMVVAAEWTSRITTISLEMVLPGIAGYWVDCQLGTVMVFLVLGVILGMTVGMIHLVRLASPPNAKGPRHPPLKRRKSSDDQSKS